MHLSMVANWESAPSPKLKMEGADRNRLRRKVKDQKGEIGDLRAVIDAYKSENEQYQKMYNSKKEENVSLKKDLKTALSLNRKLSQEKKQLKEENERLRSKSKERGATLHDIERAASLRDMFRPRHAIKEQVRASRAGPIDQSRRPAKVSPGSDLSKPGPSRDPPQIRSLRGVNSVPQDVWVSGVSLPCFETYNR